MPEALITNLVVNDTSNAGNWSVRTNIQQGDTQYGDRSYLLSSIPDSIKGCDWIRTANNSKGYNGNPVAEFTVTENSYVYVALNDNITKPSWMSAWTDTGENIVNNESTLKTFSLYCMYYECYSTVSLGNNNSSVHGMYTVMVKALITDLVVNDTAYADSWFVRGGASLGSLEQYGDVEHLLVSVPASVAGCEWIQTANYSKGYTGNPVATFKVMSDSYVYVAHSDNVSQKPAWLTGWTDTGDNLVNNESPQNTFSLYRKYYAAGSVVSLGANGSTTVSMYTVIVKVY